MWSEARQESPLVALRPSVTSVADAKPGPFRLQERSFLELVNVRGDVSSPDFVETIRSTLGTAPPARPNTVVAGHGHALAWLGPDEWMLVSDAPRRPTLEGALRPALAGQYAAVVDVSSGYTVLDLSGESVRAVLQKGCPLDLHPRVFTVGQCAQSHFFKTGILLWPLASGAWRVVVRRSFADYAVRILLDAAGEFLR
ncbi:Sarcosine oxidase subunit gamma [Pandoraea terrae]|uniref:Sarcosine oxidase subunit gamma n=1 Tax=Pandoraea terrae TaxID=1537710 RepID=A0A5E4Z1E0_9BURK|nr:sarcosine oxidase subunit gamma [Pandoraea terrae]VVE54405.1 Sarcosine oxidase subunit gamma [Pandoraea terrae]